MDKQRFVLALGGDGANDAIRGMIAAYSEAIQSLGISVVQINLEQAELQYAFGQMQQGNVSFAFTWLGFGQDLGCEVDGKRANVWDTFGIPLVKLHGDHPAYFLEYHIDIPKTSVNLYAASEFINYRRKWLKSASALTALLPPLPLSPIARESVDIVNRKRGKIVFLKNGNDAEALRRLWRQSLPASTARLVEAMAEEIRPIGLKRGALHVGDFVAEQLGRHGIDPDSAWYYLPMFTAQLDDYLRRVKSEMIARSLLDLPIIVQGNNWEHIDFTNRRAQLVHGQDFAQSTQIFANQLGVIDMSPNLDSGPHERVMRAAGSFALVLTNYQSWIRENLGDFDDLQFDFTPESIAARVESAIAQPELYVQRAMQFGERFRERYPVESVGEVIVSTGELAAQRWSPRKPELQPFFIWPRPDGY